MDFATLPEIINAARANLSPELWDYGTGGAESETTLRRNRAAFDRWALRPRVLRRVDALSTATEFLGVPLAMPVMMAPVGSISLFDPGGALTVAKAAHRNGVAPFIGSLSAPGVDEVAAGTDGPLFFQLYASGGRDWVERLVKRAEDAGYRGLCFTVDSSVYGRRERDLENRFRPLGTEERPNLRDLVNPDRREQERLTWDYVDWLAGITSMPLMLKGIQTAEDARLAIDHGVRVVYVSNHGGRQLDHAPATLDVLPEIVEAVAGRAEVLVDSGFLRGTDVVKALCLGAKAVLIGKLQCWGLAAKGEEGLSRTLEILQHEIRVTMANLGVTSVRELGPSYLAPTYIPPETIWPTDRARAQEGVV